MNMSTSTHTDPMDGLLSTPPYGLSAKEKRVLLLAALNDAYRHHFGACAAYRRYCERRGFAADRIFADITELPYLPVQAFKENTHTSGPVLVMPGVGDIQSLEDINAQFLNHHAYYDITIPSQQKPSLAKKNCQHPTPFRRHNRNQHGFTISSLICNCRLLFAKKYEATKTVDGQCRLIQ